MENLIFFSLIFSLFINFSFGAMNFSGVNRTFLSMYRGLLESSVAYVDKNGNLVEPYFDKVTLRNYVESYFEENLTRYVTHYEASIYYFNKEDDTLCTSDYCPSVKISLDCEINYFFHYSKARNFYINAKD